MTSDTPTVMIMDDESSVRMLVREILGSVGYRVVEAEDGIQGHQLMKADPADLVITDIVMPDREGIEVIQSLRKEFPSVAIIAVSGAIMGDHYLQIAKTLGADAVLPKPFKAQELIRLVRQLLPSPQPV